MFWGMGNHLEPISEASDRPGGQGLGGEAAGGQEVLQKNKIKILTQLLSMLDTMFWDMGNH